MENSAKALSFPNWARLKRDKENYPTWQKHIFDVLQAIGCDQAIRSDFARLTYESDDVSPSDDDYDGIDLSRLDLRQAKHPPPVFNYNITGTANKAVIRFASAYSKEGKEGEDQRKAKKKEREEV